MQKLRCPVCRAKFRGTRLCSRCGADLAPLMTLVERARRAREAARQAVSTDEPEAAVEAATQAQTWHATDRGMKLELLVRWLERA